jgi:hypothetical protein
MTINMVVKAINGAVVYSEGAPIPDDQFVEVPVSAHLVRAVLAGDLEEMEDAGDFHVTKPEPPPEKPEPENPDDAESGGEPEDEPEDESA